MRKQKKIIFISQPSLYRKRKKDQDSHNPEKDIFYIGRGLGHFIARWLKDKYPDIQVEIWRIEQIVSQKKERVVDGLLGKVYPLKILYNINFSYNIQFLKDLKKESKKNDTLIWFDGLHHYFFMMISFYVGNVYQVAHNLGGENVFYKYQKTKKAKYKLAEFIEARTFLKNINKGVFGTKTEYDYFTKYQVKGDSIISYVVGINRERWQHINQKVARKKLGIPENEKIILQAGRAVKNKGTHITIDAWSRFLKEKGIKLYLTGINENDELFALVKESGCDYLGMVDHEEFPYYMAAADVYLYPPFDEITLNFAGVGYAPLEALASGTPVVCTTAKFMELYGINTLEYNEIIKIPHTVENIAEMTLELLNDKPSPQKCHDFVIKHFTNDVLFGNIIDEIEKDKPDFFTHA